MKFEDASKIIYSLLKDKKTPLLITKEDNYRLAPESVRNLKINKYGISFVCSIQKTIYQLGFIWDDVLDVEQE